MGALSAPFGASLTRLPALEDGAGLPSSGQRILKPFNCHAVSTGSSSARPACRSLQRGLVV